MKIKWNSKYAAGAGTRSECELYEIFIIHSMRFPTFQLVVTRGIKANEFNKIVSDGWPISAGEHVFQSKCSIQFNLIQFEKRILLLLLGCPKPE